MAIRADSYSSAAEIVPYTRYLLQGEATFNTTSRPTLAEVEKFIDRASGVLNMALKGAGFTTPINGTNADTTSALICDEWVTNQVVAMVELTQPGAGFNETEGTRAQMFMGMHARAAEFVKEVELDLKFQGAAVTRKRSDGLQFTGQDKRAQRSDPTDSTLEQPKFRRGLHDADDAAESTSIWAGYG